MQATKDLPKKLTDGLATAFTLLLITLTLVLMVRPLEQAYGNSGLFVYAITLLAGMIFCLERSILGQLGDVISARFGLVGGILAWMVVSVSSSLGEVSISGIASLMILFLFGMVVFMLWRNLPTGGKFFLVMLLLAWFGRLMLNNAQNLVVWLPAGGNVQWISGYAYTFGALLAMVRLFLYRDRPIERTWVALALWFFLVLALSAFQGEIIL